MKEKEECNFEREEGVSKRSHSMFSAFLHQFWGGLVVQSTSSLAGLELFRAGVPMALHLPESGRMIG